MVSRADRSMLAEWWWTIDRLMLIALVSLLAGGVVLSFAASPPVAERLGLPSYHFVIRQAIFAIPALFVMVAVSFLPSRKVRRVALILFVVMLVATIATLFLGDEAKGARRWLSILGVSVQPAEFLKPAFVILTAFLFAEGGKRPELPGKLFAVLLLAMVVAPLVAQPDFGQTMLIAIVWCALFFLAGMPWKWVVSLGFMGMGGLGLAYVNLPHVAARINRFLDPSSGDTFQVDTAIESFVRGGWFGQGPGEGTVKRILPDSHTDFVFAVTAEEFGVIICILLVALFGFVVLRGLSHALRMHDAFTRLSVCGLIVLFGVQSMINMAVNLHLMPAKGMTLPFISYGGSSLVAVALGMGFVLALTRRRPQTVHIGPFAPEASYAMPHPA
jgi:cell division protein FtsW